MTNIAITSTQEQQLVTWTKLGAPITSKYTHERIRTALQMLQSYQPTLTLQGSYKNTTNTRGDSDVDMLAELKSIFIEDYSRLSEQEKMFVKLQKRYTDSQYTWSDLRNDIIWTLQDYFGSQYIDTSGKKSIKVVDHPSILDADIVPCFKHIRYTFVNRSTGFIGEEHGVSFFVPSQGRWVTNFPQQHYDNGCGKHSYERTQNKFKPTVRLYKNVKSKLVQEGIIQSKQAPSYFIECFLYNAPDRCFLENSYGAICNNILDWITKSLEDVDTMLQMKCQNELLDLFGETEEQWHLPDALKFFIEAHKLIFSL